MAVSYVIRNENETDFASIEELLNLAFRDEPHSEGDEADLVGRLRNQGALTLSLVAELEGRIIGHIGFSPAYPVDGEKGWYALGPLAVIPSAQRTGIGSQLVQSGLNALAAMEAKGCILVGHTEYYSRFGFSCTPELSPKEEYNDHFMTKVLTGKLPVATVRFHPAFD